MSSTPNQRKFVYRDLRRAAGFPVEVTCIGSPGNPVVSGRCTDLSESGMGADIAWNLIVGRVVRLDLTLPNLASRLEAEARVLYRDQDHYGLYFVGLTPAQKVDLKRECEWLARGESPASGLLALLV